jgi:hypothetical protein
MFDPDAAAPAGTKVPTSDPEEFPRAVR